MEEETVQSVESTETKKDKISIRNLITFPLGTLGRDCLYSFFNGYLISFILLTKHLTTAQFGSITFIIVAARIFDALNDPLMGGIVENTRTKWGKYKPWMLIGAILTGLVIIMLFNVPLDGWAFIGFLAASYFLFSITFTMNDISYWGMLPTLTTDPHDRDKLTSFTQIVCGLGAGVAGLIVPAFTTGAIGTALFGSAVKGYRILSIIIVVLMIAFQMITILGVKEKPLDLTQGKVERLKVKDMFRVIFKNDQLLWNSLILLLFNIGTNVVTVGLLTYFIYFMFGYDGIIVTVFSAGYAVISTIFTLFYPWLCKRFGRDKLLYSTGFAIIIGFALLLIFGLAIPETAGTHISILGFEFDLTVKFAMMFIAYAIAGWGGGFYLINVINLANTVEYNEYKTGNREEGLIFSLRPFTVKMGSAIMQGITSLVLIAAGALAYTNQISDIENEVAANPGDTALAENKLQRINDVISSMPEKSKDIILICMCVIPIVFLSVALIIYKKKCFLNEAKMNEILEEIKSRKEESNRVDEENPTEEIV